MLVKFFKFFIIIFFIGFISIVVNLGFSLKALKNLNFKKNKKSFVLNDLGKKEHLGNSSLYYSFQTLPFENSYKIIPSFEVQHDEIKPYTIFYDQNDQSKVEFRVFRNGSISSLIKETQKYNPFFKFYYPTLDSFATKNPEIVFFDADESREWEEKKADFKNELMSLVSLMLRDITYLDSAQEWGPLLQSFSDLREKFFSLKMSNETDKTIRFMTLGNQTFLLVFSEKRLLMYPVGTVFFKIYEFRGERNSIVNLINRYFSESKWSIDYYGVISFPENSDDMNLFNIVDYFMLKKLHPKHRNLIEQYTVEYLDLLVSECIEDGDDIFKKEILITLEKFKILTKLKKNNEQTYYSEFFIDKLISFENRMNGDRD